MTIGYSKEVLYHFSCGECKKWWTVGDWQGRRTTSCTVPTAALSRPWNRCRPLNP